MFARILLTLSFIAWFSGYCSAQDGGKIFKSLSVNETEELLKELKLDYKKSTPKSEKKDNLVFFDLPKGKAEHRLTWFEGQDLMLDRVFPPIPLSKVNEWNIGAKFSRLSLQKSDAGEFTVLEFNLDLRGGVTRGAIVQFLEGFEKETAGYERFIQLAKTGETVAGDDKILDKVDDDVIEKVLKTSNLKFEKKSASKGIMVYDFKMHDFMIRLYNYAGEDLMIDAHFKKVSLEDINNYNLNRKFIRAVGYSASGRELTALEGNFECASGVSPGMIRHFIFAFGEDVRHFASYLQGNKGADTR